jgi:type II secretory pathway pseudopilin PulG
MTAGQPTDEQRAPAAQASGGNGVPPTKPVERAITLEELDLQRGFSQRRIERAAAARSKPPTEREADAEWRRSPQYVRASARTLPLLLLGVFLVYGGGAGVSIVVGPVTAGKPQDAPLPFALAVVGVVMGLVALAAALSIRSLARARFLEQQTAAAAASVDKALDDVRTEQMSLSSLLRLNRDLMEQYHALSRQQAEDSYFFSKLASFLGLTVLVGGAFVAVLAPDTSTKVAAATLASVGTVLATYIGRTFLHTYQTALVQLNWYFEQPLVNSYLLTAERLCERLDNSRRDPVLQRVIEIVMDCAVQRSEIPGAQRQKTPRRRLFTESALGVQRRRREPAAAEKP